MDDADITGERMLIQEAARLAEVRRNADAIPIGTPGECDLCGEESGRLVRGVCARCRDLHKRP